MSRAIGDFSGLKGGTVQEVLEAIPLHATHRKLLPIAGAVNEGIEYKWVEGGVTWRVRMHGPDPSAPSGTHANTGWVVRIQRQHRFMDSQGNFHARGVNNPASPHYDPKAANDTHIPLQTPGDAGEFTR